MTRYYYACIVLLIVLAHSILHIVMLTSQTHTHTHIQADSHRDGVEGIMLSVVEWSQKELEEAETECENSDGDNNSGINENVDTSSSSAPGSTTRVPGQEIQHIGVGGSGSGL